MVINSYTGYQESTTRLEQTWRGISNIIDPGGSIPHLLLYLVYW